MVAKFTTPFSLLVLTILAGFLSTGTNAFVHPSAGLMQAQRQSTAFVTSLAAKKKPEIDLSDIETRDMTREEMLDLNKQNEEIMNMELSMMTGFSLIISLPLLYLCWVAFFSE